MSELVQEKQSRHVLVITFPAQGHLNPTLQFAKRLAKLGTQVTFVTTTFAHRRMSKHTAAGASVKGLNFRTFSDGHDEDGYVYGVTDNRQYSESFKAGGSNALREVIIHSAEQGRPVAALVYTLFLPWAAQVAREFHTPFAILWIQPATVLQIYHYYFNGHEDEITQNCVDPNWSLQLPGLTSPLSKRDLPSFLVPPKDPKFSLLLERIKEQIDIFSAEKTPRILINTFDALEPEALKSIKDYKLIGVGPLIPSAFLDGEDPSDTSFGGDLFDRSKGYMEWLNSKPESSVVYVSFGSMLNLGKEEMEEMGRGLVGSGRPFLWVARVNENGGDENMMSFVEGKGMIVPWCSQLEVLTHPSVGCFVTHCGWNSTLESMACGVPVVAFPHWTDQGTNAKMIEDVWRVGVRVRGNNGKVESDEINKCVEMVMGGGERGEEVRSNARRWKVLAKEAMQQGGSSYENLKSLVEQVGTDFH